MRQFAAELLMVYLVFFPPVLREANFYVLLLGVRWMELHQIWRAPRSIIDAQNIYFGITLVPRSI